MNSARRVVLGLYSLLFIAALGGLVALTWRESKQLDLNIGDWNVVAFTNASDTAKVIFTIAAGALILVGLVTLFIAFAADAAGGRSSVRLKQADGGTVYVTPAALERLLQTEIERLPEVRQAYPRIRVSGGAVNPDIAVAIFPDASISHVTTAVGNTTAQTLREQVGVSAVRRPNIRVQYDDLPGRPKSQKAPPPSMMTPEPMSPATPWPEPDIDHGDRAIYPPQPAGVSDRDRPPDAHD